MSARWALSRSGSILAAARPASIASPNRRLGEPVAQALEGVRPQLAEPLPLERDPVVVPVGKHVAEEPDLAQPRALRARRVEQAVGLRDGRIDVDANVRGEPERLAGRFDEPVTPVQTPERRAQASRRPVVGRVEPERSRDVGTLERLPFEREEGEHALAVHRQRHGLASDRELEPTEQGEPRGVRSTSGIAGAPQDQRGNDCRSNEVAPDSPLPPRHSRPLDKHRTAAGVQSISRSRTAGRRNG